MSKIRIIALRMGERPQAEEIDSGLEAMQSFVEGMITCVALDGDYSGGCDLWCNDEGLYTKKPNRHVKVGERFSQVLNGPMFIAAHDDEGETVGLSDEQFAKWRALAAKWPRAMTSVAEDYVPLEGELLLIM